MDSIVVALLPFIIGSAVVPLQIIIVILLLTSGSRGPLKAIAFVLGMTLARLVQGFLFQRIISSGSGDPADVVDLSTIKATVLMLLGIFLLITAYRKWANEPDPDAPPPKWMTMLDGITPLRSFLFGAGIILIAVKLWVFTLGALAVIDEAQLGQASNTVFLVYVLLAQSILILAILLRLIVPKRAARLLGSVSAWLETHNRQIVMIVSLVFGLLFFYQGVSGFFAIS